MKKLRKLFGGIGSAGLSFIELIITVAIMGVVGTTVAGAMYVSSRSYTRGAAEVNVQEEAQTALNLISDWVMDATKVTCPDPKTLEITHPNGGTTNVITVYQSGKELKYKVDSDTEEYTLCDFLDESKGVTFNSTFDTNRNVNVSIDFDINGRTYHAATDTTSRNHDFTLNSTGTDVLNLVVPDNTIVLEPAQSGSAAYTFSALIYGVPTGFDPSLNISDSSGDISATCTTPTAIGSSVYSSTITCTSTNTAIDAGSFRINLSYTDAGGAVHTDSEVVTTLVRRATKCAYTTADKDYLAPIAGDEGKSGSMYINTVDLGIINGNSHPNSAYDQGSFAYIDPSKVQFYVRYADGSAVDSSAYTMTVVDHGSPSVTIVLNTTISKDICVYVSSVHSGKNSAIGLEADNKATRLSGGNSVSYTSGGGAYVTYFKIKKGGDPDITGIGAGFQRGSHAFRLGKLSPEAMTNVQSILDHYAGDKNNLRQVVYFRYADKATFNPSAPEGTDKYTYSSYIYTTSNNGNQFIDNWAVWGNNGAGTQMYLTDIFELSKAYVVEVHYDLIDTTNWTTLASYQSEGSVNAANQYVYNSNQNWFEASTGENIGTYSNPVIVNGANPSFYVYYDSLNLFNNQPWKMENSDNTRVVYKYKGLVGEVGGVTHPTQADIDNASNWEAANLGTVQGVENIGFGGVVVKNGRTFHEVNFMGTDSKLVGGFDLNTFPDVGNSVVANDVTNMNSGLYRISYYRNSGDLYHIVNNGSAPSPGNINGTAFTMDHSSVSREKIGDVYYKVS